MAGQEDGSGVGQSLRAEGREEQVEKKIRATLEWGGAEVRTQGDLERSEESWGGRQPLVSQTPRNQLPPPALLLPPDLAELQEVDEGLQQPDAEATAAAAVGAGRGGRGPGSQLRAALFGQEGGGAVLSADGEPAGAAVLGADGGSQGPRGRRVVVDEPAEAEQLHHQRGQEYKQQREAEVGPLTLQVVGGRQPQVRGAVGEEHEQRAQHPAAVPQPVARPRAPQTGNLRALGGRRLPPRARAAPGSPGRPLQRRAGRGRRSIRLSGHVGGAGGGEQLPGGGGGGVRSGEDTEPVAPASSSSSFSSSSSSLYFNYSLPLAPPSPLLLPPGLWRDGEHPSPREWRWGQGKASQVTLSFLHRRWGVPATCSLPLTPRPAPLPSFLFSAPRPSPSAPFSFISCVYLQWPGSEEHGGQELGSGAQADTSGTL